MEGRFVVGVKRIFLSLLLVIGIVLLAIGFFTGSGTNVSADDRIDKIKDEEYIDSIRAEDSIEIINGKTKTYTSKERQLRIEDFGGMVLEMKLTSPYKNKVSPGDSILIAEWFLIDFSGKLDIFDKVDSYNVNDNYKIKSEIYDWKYLVEREITDCYDSSKVNNKTGKNESVEICYDYIQRDWVSFSRIDELPHKNIYVGLFTDTVEGEYVEFVPTIEGFEVLEWASFLVTDLISYYKLDEASGDVLDAHSSNDATNGGATPGATGILNDAYDFERGENDQITMPDTLFPSFGTTGTFNVWVNIESQSIFQVLFDIGKADYQSFMWIHSDNKIKLEIYDNGAVFGATSTSAYTWNDGWHMVTFTSNSGGNAFYVDGSPISMTYATGSSSTVKFFNSLSSMSGTIRTLGGQWNDDSGRAFDGIMDEVGFWSDGLNSDNVSELYGGGSPPSYPFAGPQVDCTFSGFTKDEQDNALNGANITIWNQFDVSEFYEVSSDVNGAWAINVTNSTNTYMVGAYFNNTLIGQLKPYISGTC